MATKVMKTVTKTAKEMMTNKYVLYTLLLLAILNVLAFLITNNFISLAVFALVGLLTTYFTKNMSVVLLVSLVVSSFLHISKATVEKMTNKEDGEKESGNEADSEDEADSDDEVEEPEEPAQPKKDKVKGHVEDDAPMTKGNKHKLNHQATVEESYSNIHGILGSKNFKKMTKDTKKLLDQQTKLTESLNNMAPILKNAESVLGKFDMEKMTGMLDSLNLSVGGKKKN
jgi:hypothetical protein